MNRLEIKRDYTWVSVINKATKYIDELIDNVCFKDLSLVNSFYNQILILHNFPYL